MQRDNQNLLKVLVINSTLCVKTNANIRANGMLMVNNK